MKVTGRFKGVEFDPFANDFCGEEDDNQKAVEIGGEPKMNGYASEMAESSKENRQFERTHILAKEKCDSQKQFN